MLARDIIDSMRSELNDPVDVRWPLPVKLRALSDALLQLALVRPDAAEATEELALADGSRQQLPADGLRLIDVPRNISGQPIRRVDRATLDASGAWHGAKPAEVVRSYTFDDRRPTQFYVYPPAAAGVKVEVSYVRAPAAVTDLDDPLQASAVYLGPLRDWALYRCYAVETGTGSAHKAQHYHNSFYQSLGVKLQSDALISPKAEGNP